MDSAYQEGVKSRHGALSYYGFDEGLYRVIMELMKVYSYVYVYYIQSLWTLSTIKGWRRGHASIHVYFIHS